jgi:hypothetical protein
MVPFLFHVRLSNTRNSFAVGAGAARRQRSKDRAGREQNWKENGIVGGQKKNGAGTESQVENNQSSSKNVIPT